LYDHELFLYMVAGNRLEVHQHCGPIKHEIAMILYRLSTSSQREKVLRMFVRLLDIPIMSFMEDHLRKRVIELEDLVKSTSLKLAGANARNHELASKLADFVFDNHELQAANVDAKEILRQVRASLSGIFGDCGDLGVGEGSSASAPITVGLGNVVHVVYNEKGEAQITFDRTNGENLGEAMDEGIEEGEIPVANPALLDGRGCDCSVTARHVRSGCL